MTANPLLLRMKNISVSYQDVKALRGVDFDLRYGEIHALVGEHRAGKTTLVKVLNGSVKQDSGEIVFDGSRVERFTPQSSLNSGIGMVYQDENVLDSLNAVENIFAGRLMCNWGGRIDYPAMVRRTEELMARLRIEMDIHTPLNRLSKADQHMVELAKALAHDPKLIIVDEISSKLTPQEMELVYPVLLRSREQGKSIIYITHNMDEVFQFADRVTILKDGCRTGTENISDIDRIDLIKLTYSFVLSRNELKRDNVNLYYFKKYNETIIKNLPIGVIILDPLNRVYMINFNALKTLDLYEQSAREKPVQEVLTALAPKVKRKLINSIKQKESCIWKEEVLSSGKYVSINTYPFQDEDYKYLGTIILIEDITDRHQVMEYLLRTQKIASTAELAAGVAHEINNPLGIIHNYIEILRERSLDRDTAEKIDKVNKEIERIGSIVGNLLSFSRLNVPPQGQVSLPDVLRDVLVLINHRIKEKSISITSRLPVSGAFITGDENRLKQLFLNLLLNSVEAVDDGGYIHVVMKNHPRKGYVRTDITDNGHGIGKDLMEKIFDPFFTTKSGKKNTGLGLAVSQHIVEMHDGIITCSSTPGKTTTFTIRFQTVV